MIVDQAGNLVWFHPLPAHEEATNLQVQQYEGKPVLTWWQGRILEVGFGQGEDVDLRHLLPARRRDPRRQRLQSRPARDPPDPAGHGLDRHLRSGVHEPLKRARPQQRRRQRLRDRGDRHQDRPRDVGVARARAHRAQRIVQPDPPRQLSLGLHPHQLVDPGPSGDVLLSARNSWTLYDVDMHSGGFRWRWATSTAASGSARACASTGSTTPNSSPAG